MTRPFHPGNLGALIRVPGEAHMVPGRTIAMTLLAILLTARTVAAQDALFSINGLPISSADNNAVRGQLPS